MFSAMFKIAETAMIMNHHPNMTGTFTTDMTAFLSF
jgi:pterin-4a-carbinolamine dehydratase